MASGNAVAVTCVPLVSQWAEMQRIALGLENFLANVYPNSLSPLSSMAFIGLPWAKNEAGISCSLLGIAACIATGDNSDIDIYPFNHQIVLELCQGLCIIFVG
jgi:hypothetical protein